MGVATARPSVCVTERAASPKKKKAGRFGEEFHGCAVISMRRTHPAYAHFAV